MWRFLKYLFNQSGQVAAVGDPPANEFLNSLPEDLRAEPSLQVFKDLPTFAKSYIETKRMVGGSIRLPDEKATPEDIDKWRTDHLPKLYERKILDAPPSEYKIPDIEGYHPDPALTDRFLKDIATKYKLPQAAVEDMIAFDHERTKALQGSVNVLTPELADAEMKTVLGTDYDKVTATVKEAMIAFNETYPGLMNEDKLNRTYVVEIDEKGQPGKTYPIMKHPLMYGMLDQVGVLIKEDHAGNVGHETAGESQQSIQDKIDAIERTDGPKNRAWKNGDQRVMDELAALYEIKAKFVPRKEIGMDWSAPGPR